MKKGQSNQEQIVRIQQDAEKGDKRVAAITASRRTPITARDAGSAASTCPIKKLLAERDLAVGAIKELWAKTHRRSAGTRDFWSAKGFRNAWRHNSSFFAGPATGIPPSSQKTRSSQIT
jgi:hypothetical protein